MSDSEKTQVFTPAKQQIDIRQTMIEVAQALKEAGYNPASQLANYLLSGDPTYITMRDGARSKMDGVDKYDVLAEIVNFFVDKNTGETE